MLCGLHSLPDRLTAADRRQLSAVFTRYTVQPGPGLLLGSQQRPCLQSQHRTRHSPLHCQNCDYSWRPRASFAQQGLACLP